MTTSFAEGPPKSKYPRIPTRRLVQAVLPSGSSRADCSPGSAGGRRSSPLDPWPCYSLQLDFALSLYRRVSISR